MKKPTYFIILCMLLCLIPSVGMLFFPTTRTSENRAMAEAPKLTAEDGSLNRAFFPDFESYFTEHMALRNELVYADAQIQSKVFHESNVSGVICGSDGWLYYSSTLDDYLGRNILSERELYCLANNFSVVQDYLQGQGIDFVLTIAPNKNTLYGDNMPYYQSAVVDDRHSARLLAPYLAQQDVRYVDLFSLFEAQEEVLYCKLDSHWNNKGALLVYDALMDALELPHEDHASVTPTVFADRSGDLNRMLYSFYGPSEPNYDYGLPQTYAYANEADDVEDRFIVTENPQGSGRLLMFRDSFANTLIPFFSNEFATACYSKGEPNMLELYLEQYQPDQVVIEKVERNITDYLAEPPVLTAPTAALPQRITIADTDSTVTLEESPNDLRFYQLRGTVDAARLQTDSQVLVCVGETVYRAYLTGESEFMLYLPKAALSGATADIRVYALQEDMGVQVLFTTLALPQ